MRGFAAVLGAAFVMGAYALDRQMLWLAHPIWQIWGVAAAVLIGAGLAALLPGNARWQGLMAGFFALVAGYLSWAGKADFAASYAEDALAGRYWYIGYHAMLLLAGFGLTRALSFLLARRAG